MDQTTHTRKTRITEADVEKEDVVQKAPKTARLVKLKDSTRSASPRIEKIRCEEKGCTDIVAKRRADGRIVRRHKRRGETHITIIEPWPPPGERNRVEIRCAVGDCARIVAEWRTAGVVVIREKHHGREHVTIIEPWPSAPRQDLADDVVKPVTAPDTSSLP